MTDENFRMALGCNPKPRTPKRVIPQRDESGKWWLEMLTPETLERLLTHESKRKRGDR